MWAAFARPLRPLNVSCQFRLAPAPDFVRVAVNAPRAPLTLPVGEGTSSAAVSAVVSWSSVAWLVVPAVAAVTAMANPSAPIATLGTRVFIVDLLDRTL